MTDFARLARRRTVLTKIAALDRDQADDPEAIEAAVDRVLTVLDAAPFLSFRQLERDHAATA